MIMVMTSRSVLLHPSNVPDFYSSTGKGVRPFFMSAHTQICIDFQELPILPFLAFWLIGIGVGIAPFRWIALSRDDEDELPNFM